MCSYSDAFPSGLSATGPATAARTAMRGPGPATDPVRRIGGLLTALVRAAVAWRDVARGRRAVAKLSPRLRRDVGLPDTTAGDAPAELRMAELHRQLGARIGPRRDH